MDTFIFIIFVNLTLFSRLAQSVRAAMGFSIFLSYGLQFYVPIGIVWPALKGYFHSQSSQHYAELSVRVFLVTLTCKYIIYVYIYVCFLTLIFKNIFTES